MPQAAGSAAARQRRAVEQSGGMDALPFSRGRDGVELACRCRRGEVLIYSQYPMAARGEWAAALEACGEANSALTRGAMFLRVKHRLPHPARLGRPLTGARERLAEALEYKRGGDGASYWGAFQNACRG